MTAEARIRDRSLEPYVPRLLLSWLAEHPDDRHARVEGTLVLADISGFTALSERLARKGKVGAEEVADTIGACFQRLLGVAYAGGGGLLKFGGDAILLLFSGRDHRTRALRTAIGMRRALRQIGPLAAPGGRVSLRMSIGVHAGDVDLFLVGGSHRELIIAGPGATRAVVMEAAADAGEIVVSPETGSDLPAGLFGPPKGDGRLLRREPKGLGGEPSPSPPPVSRDSLETTIPEGIRSHLAEGGGDSEHRMVAVAFVHFDGIDDLIDRRGPAAAATELQDLVVRVQRAADRHEVTFLGTDVDRDGGKIILAAGAPQATGHDEERMLVALREISDVRGPLTVRIGCNRGRVFAGDIGPPYRRTYTVMGDAVNLAARLMSAAGPGEILVSGQVAEASPTRFELDPLPPLSVKGKARPIRAYRLRAHSRPTRPGRVEDGDGLPFIGREREMAVLLEALASARSGRGQVVEVVGDAGIGKSRLAGELRARAGDATVFPVACELYESATPYFPFRRSLRTLLDLPEGHSEDAPRLLREAVGRSAPELLAWLPLIGLAVDVAAPETPETEALAEEFRRPALERAVIDLLASIEDTLVLTVEDAHWMDEASGDLLRRMSVEAADRPWLICVTRRDEDTGFAAPEGSHVRTLRPEPLGAAEAAELIRLETEGSPLAPHDIAALADRAGGNPLFLRELVAMAGEGSPVEELPGSVEAAVTARIDRLSSGHRSLLRRLAVLGETFSDDLLPSVLPEDHPLPDPDTWRRLEDFIRPSGPGTLRFDHALIRDAAYEGLPYRLRRELHTRVGQTIERASYPNLEEQAEVLSLHYFAAGRYDAAWLHARVAGDRARDLYANAEAATFYDRALEAARHIGDVPDVVRAELHESLGDVLERLGEYGRAAAAYRAARRLVAGDRVAEARLLWKQGWIRDRAGRFSEAIRWIGRGLRSLEGITGEAAARQRAQLTVWYAAVRQAQGRNREAIRWARRAVDEASQAGERQALAHAYYLLDWALVDTGRGEEASCSQDALAIYRELGDLPGQATVLNNMAGFAYLEGRWDEALERYREAREASSRAGDAVNAAIPTAGIAEILLEQGHLGAAEELLKEALRVWIAAGHWWGRAYATLNRGRIAARAGDLKGAEALLEEARETFRDGGAAGYVSEVDARIAELRLLQGRPREALDLADRLLAQGGSITYGPVLHRVRGCALARLGELEAAEEALRSSLGLARDGRASHEVAATLLALIDLAEMRGVPPPDRAGPEAREILDRLRIESPPPSLLADRSATLSA